MPHDANGRELKAGDLVDLRCRVVAVFPQERACNVQLEPVERPEGEMVSVYTMNTRFVRAVDSASLEQREG